MTETFNRAEKQSLLSRQISSNDISLPCRFVYAALYHILLLLTLSNIIPRSLFWHKALLCG